MSFKEETLDSIKSFMEEKPEGEWQNHSNPRKVHLQKLLTALQNHLLAYLIVKTKPHSDADSILNDHLRQLFPLVHKMLNKSADILEDYPPSLELLYNVLLDSVAGSMFFKILNSLLLMPADFVKDLLPLLLDVLGTLDRFNKLLPPNVLLNDFSAVSSSKFVFFTDVQNVIVFLLVKDQKRQH